MKAKKIVISLLFAVLFVFATLFTVTFNGGKKFATASEPKEQTAETGVLFVDDGSDTAVTEPYALEKNILSSPKTIEVVVKLNATATTNVDAELRYGAAFGGFGGGTIKHFNIEFDANGVPSVWWYDNRADIGFEFFANQAVPKQEWTTVTFVRDDTTNKLSFYINGVDVGGYYSSRSKIKEGIGADWTIDEASETVNTYYVGSDARATRLTYRRFNGAIKFIGLSTTAKTATEIKTAYDNSKADNPYGFIKDVNSVKKGATDTIIALNLPFVDNLYDYYKGYKASQSTRFQLENGYTTTPKSIETLFRLSGEVNTVGNPNRPGPIMGGFGVKVNEEAGQHFNLEIMQGNFLRFWWCKDSKIDESDEIDWRITDIALPTNQWIHLVYVRNTDTNQLECYINGVLAATREGVGANLDNLVPHWVGSDARKANYFCGDINYIALSSEIKTASEVSDAYTNAKRLINITDKDTIDAIDFFQMDKTSVKSFYRSTLKVPSTPNTFTATVKMPEVYTSNKVGVMYGTYVAGNSFSKDVINYEFSKTGKLRVYWQPGITKTTNTDVADIYFTYNFEVGKTYSITVTRDKTNKKLSLYVNGVWVEDSGVYEQLATEMYSLYPPALGADLRWTNRPVFKGELYSVAVYSEVLTAEQILAEYNQTDKTKITKNEYSSLMANWVLNQKQSKLYLDETEMSDVIDYSGNGNNAFLCTDREYFEPEDKNWFEVGEDEYTLIYVPDTQITSARHIGSSQVMFDWIVENAEAMNLKFVMGLGDIQDGNPTQASLNSMKNERGLSIEGQWKGMQAIYAKLTEAGIPWSAVAGNHDYVPGHTNPTTANGRKLDIYNEYFGVEAIGSNANNIISYYEEGLTSNVIYEFSAGEVKYLCIAFEYGPSDKHLEWAESVITKPEYANHRILVNSHYMVFANGYYGSSQESHGPDGGWTTADGGNANKGGAIWDKLISKHDNMFIAAGGHIMDDSIMHRTDVADYGNKVLGMLIDGQAVPVYNAACYGASGDALIAIAKFNEKTQTMTLNYYNPENGMLFTRESQFTFDYSGVMTTKQIIKDEEVVTQKDYATIGDTVSFSINATAGFVYAKPIVTDLNGNEITYTEIGGTYTFTMPSSRVIITVEKLDLSTITLPQSIMLKVGESVDLSQYIPQGDFVLTTSSSAISIQGYVVTANASATVELTLSSQKYGISKSCSVVVEKEQTSSSSSSSSSSASSSSSLITSTSSSSSSSSSVIVSTSSSNSSSSSISSSVIVSTSTSTTSSSSSSDLSSSSSSLSSSQTIQSSSSLVSTSTLTSQENSTESSSQEVISSITASTQTSLESSSEQSSEDISSSESVQNSSQTTEITSSNQDLSSEQVSSDVSSESIEQSSQSNGTQSSVVTQTAGGCSSNITNASTILIVLVIISSFVLIRKKHN